MSTLHSRFARLQVFLSRSIWQSEHLSDRSLRGRFYGILRIASMIWSGLVENNLASRAGALSYSSMLALGPLVALIVLFSSAVLQRTDPNFAVNQLNRVITFIAPQVNQLSTGTTAAPGSGTVPTTGDESGTPAADPSAVNPEIVEFLNNVIAGSQSKAIGVVGILSLIVIVIQLFTSIENAFNGIWGVRRGRNWLLRIVYYWAAVTLGAVLAFTALTLLSASTFVSVLESLPLGPEIRHFFLVSGPVISGLVLVGLLAVFYKFIPNTTVRWLPAIAGAVIVVMLINLNNYLAFLYLSTVVRSQSLYGSLGLLPILMLGLYVFWLFLLVGGQITYAVQNANYRGSNMAWADLNHTARQGISILVLTIVARRFRACRDAYSAAQISDVVKIPSQILNACLARLIQLSVLTPVPPDDRATSMDLRYQPARPLDTITLADFKEHFESDGAGPSKEILGTLDPVVRHFFDRSSAAIDQALGESTLDDLIDGLPVIPDDNGKVQDVPPPGEPASA